MEKATSLYLPNRRGNYAEVKIPKYLLDILYDGKGNIRIVEMGHYRYRIYGWNYSRPCYGIKSDIERIKKFLDRFATFEDGTSMSTITDIDFHIERNNYYVKFKMLDPWALAFERAGLIKLKDF